MIIQATPYGTKKEEPFAFTYSGDFTDERVDGIGDVTLNTSGTLIVTGKAVTVSVYILGAGGGAAVAYRQVGASNTLYYKAGGGSGGYQTIEIELVPGTYDIVIGIGGAGRRQAVVVGGSNTAEGSPGGNTTAFGHTCTGGTGGIAGTTGNTAGAGGSPNGNSGSTGTSGDAVAGGLPNGGKAQSNKANKGGNGLVRITFS